MSSLEEARNAEIELKFEIEAASLARLKTHPAVSVRGGKRLRSVYFDTPAHDLRGAGLTLRVRESGGRFVQTVKTREGPGMIQRGEWECAVRGGRPDVEALARTPAAALLHDLEAASLEPVFSTTVQRAVRLWEADGAQVEVAFDRGEIQAGDDHEPIHEIELELKAGAPAALFALAHDLSGAAPMRLSFDTKAERGYRLATHDAAAAVKAEPAGLGPDTPTIDAFRRCARSCLVQVVGNAQALRRARSPQAVHQARVGLRRLRSVLSTFKPLIADARFQAMVDEVRWLGHALDAARDLDVFIHETLGQDTDAAPAAGVTALKRRLLAAQGEAYGQATTALDSQRFADFLLDFTTWVEVGEWSRSGEADAVALGARPVAAYAAAALDRLDHKVRSKGRRLKQLAPEARHDLRIAAKKLRYASELFAEAFPDRPKRRHHYVEALKTMQDRLGALNDLAVASRVAMTAVGKRNADAAFAAGLLIGRRSRSEPKLLDQAGDDFRRFAAAEPFWDAP